MNDYQKMAGRKQLLDFREEVFGEKVDKTNIVESLNTMNLLVDTVYRAEKESFNSSIINLEEGGIIVYE